MQTFLYIYIYWFNRERFYPKQFSDFQILQNYSLFLFLLIDYI